MTLLSNALVIASQRFPRLSSRILASSGYTLDLERFAPDAFGVWTESTSLRQDRAWQPIVAATKAGKPREDVAALYAAMDEIDIASPSVLEVGCGGGYNSEILAHRYPDLDYAGLDLSAPMIEISREHYPQRKFSVGSAYDLPFADDSVDVVIDGVALLHMLEWKTAIAQYARVSRRYVLLHGLTLTEGPTTTFGKYAYGQPSLELVQNRAEVLGECVSNGLTLLTTQPGLDYDLEEYIGIPSVSETWLLEL